MGGAGAAPPDPNACNMGFENAADEAIEIMWKMGGKEQSMGTLKVGARTSLQSFKGHGFYMKSTTGESRSSNMITCTPPSTEVSLTAGFVLEDQPQKVPPPRPSRRSAKPSAEL